MIEREPPIGARGFWGKDEVIVLGIERGIGEAIKFRRERDGKTLRCGLSYFMRMAAETPKGQTDTVKGTDI